jgi:hypothetical protein
MSVGEGWTDRRRAREEDYFRKRDQELVEKVRLRGQEEAARDRLAERAGIFDEDLLQTLQKLGYTAETVSLLHVLPLLDVAWADGQLSHSERDVILAAARSRGVEPGSPADVQLAEWLLNPPSDVLRDGTLHVLGAMLQMRPAEERSSIERGLLSSCTAVATASGGVLGFGTISDQEQQAMDRIVYELERKAGA